MSDLGHVFVARRHSGQDPFELLKPATQAGFVNSDGQKGEINMIYISYLQS